MKQLRGIFVFLLCFLVFGQAISQAESWQKKYPEITLGVITSENEADRVERYKPVRAYLEETLGVKIKWRSATDYAGVIEALKSKKIEGKISKSIQYARQKTGYPRNPHLKN